MQTTAQNWILSFNTNTGRNFAININRANHHQNANAVEMWMNAMSGTGVLQNVRDGIVGLPTTIRHAILRTTTRTPIN